MLTKINILFKLLKMRVLNLFFKMIYYRFYMKQ